MSLKNTRELEVTQNKLAMLEQQHAELKTQVAEDAHVRELTLRSLKRRIKQLQEEIARFHVQAASSGRG